MNIIMSKQTYLKLEAKKYAQREQSWLEFYNDVIRNSIKDADTIHTLYLSYQGGLKK